MCKYENECHKTILFFLFSCDKIQTITFTIERYDPFYGLASTTSWLRWYYQRQVTFQQQSPVIPGTRFIDSRWIKDKVDNEAT